MHKRIIKMSIILALCVCAFNVRGVYAQDLKVGTHIEHEYEISVVRRATEHTDGERLYKCKICGESHVETIEATGHIWSEWIVDVSPTETKEGHRYRVCTKYPEHPHYQEEVIPALLSSPKSANTAKTVNTALKKDAKTDNTNKNDLKNFQVKKYLNDEKVYLTPNMTYNPRLMKKEKGYIVNGSVAILIPKYEFELTEAQKRYISSDEFRTFYKIARNYQTRSLNIDKTSCYWFGINLEV